MSDPSGDLTRGATLTLRPHAMAHGGEAVAYAPDGRVVFIGGAIPGDTVSVTLDRVKKRWARADVVEVLEPSPDRVEHACPAAAAGAGCCDYSHIAPAAQQRFKREVLIGQLVHHTESSLVLRGFDLAIDLEEETLEPTLGWRTRTRLGVGQDGRAGVRKARSNDIVADVACTQVVPGALDGIVGPGARTFTPGAELVVVMDSHGQRHVVETAKAQRGRRIEWMETVIEGDMAVTEVVPVGAGGQVEDFEFVFPPTAFWQAHSAAPATYSRYITDWAADDYERPIGWDLYGGVGVFVPSISKAMGGHPHIDSVDYSVAATQEKQQCLSGFDVTVHSHPVETGLIGFADPGLVVLDPPRTGAGAHVVEDIAQYNPQRVIHIGCDPATFARDLASWGNNGYVVERMALVDAFPMTHHFEVVCSLVPA